jgi:aminopeptidase
MKLDFAPKLAQVITHYSTAVKPGDFVVISGPVEATPLLEALYQAVLERGGSPVVSPTLAGFQELFFNLANDDQLAFVNPLLKLIVEQADVWLTIEAPFNTKALANVPPEKITRYQQAMAPLFPVQLERMASGSLRWCLMPWPTGAAAQQTDMGLHAYADFLYSACGLDRDDPVAYWQSVQEKQERLVAYLNGKSRAEVRGPGIDLSFDFTGRTWVSAHGTLNFPDGEIFTGPVEDSVNGTVEFNMRTVLNGREVSGVRFRFEDGVVVEASAAKGEDFLLSQLDADDGARRLGEFAIGTNWGIDRVTGSTLLDEKIGGSIHMAVGASLPMTGGVNQSVVHWDMVHDMKDGGEITIDGRLFYRAGHFTID